MPPQTRFRLSTCLTLAFAASALGYAEYEMFPEVGVFAAIVVLALALIALLESRLEVLSIADANKLGIGIAILSTGWVAFRVLREIRTGEYAQFGWQMFAMALFGAVLLLLIPAKLLRKEKHVGDWWGMQTMGLATIALAGAMADGPEIFALLGVYLFCGVWSLTELFRGSSSGSIPPVPQKGVATQQKILFAVPGVRSHASLRIVTLWVVAAAAIAVPLFLLTPRSSAPRFIFGQQRLEVGYTGNQMVDLKRTGTLEDNPEPVFIVSIINADGSPNSDYDTNRRWRGTSLSKYQNGSWSVERFRLPPVTPTSGVRPARNWEPPNFGSAAYRIHYTLLTDDKLYFLADPVVWEAGQFAPIATECSLGLQPWLAAGDGSGTFFRSSCGATDPGIHYVQYARDPREPDLSTGFEIAPTSDAYIQPIVGNYPVRVKEYADSLLQQLVTEGRLPPEAAGSVSRDRARLLPPVQHHEIIAREFCRHLSEDTKFVYTTNLRRGRTDVDPVEEFLFELRAGHCQRFATALVMMLRSQGIPAVFVLGFRGCEPLEDGKYVVRQQQTHSWVEALISRPGGPATPTNPDGRVWHWLSLDPAPMRSDDDADANQGQNIFTRAMGWIKAFADSYILNYSTSRREKTLLAVRAFATDPITWVCGGGIVTMLIAIVVVRRRQHGRRHQDAEQGDWYERLVMVLTEFGFTPGPGVTPREYATGVEDVLRHHPRAQACASVPTDWVEAHYLARFGGTPIAPTQQVELESQLEALRESLKA